MQVVANVSSSGVVPAGEENRALHRVAERLVWWQPPEVSLQQPQRLIAQVMTLGNWEDVQTVRRVFGDEAFRAVLAEPPAGVFDVRSWTYWHHVFHLLPVPPLPKRRL